MLMWRIQILFALDTASLADVFCNDTTALTLDSHRDSGYKFSACAQGYLYSWRALRADTLISALLLLEQ